jgi:hypothetical protein
MWLPESSLEIMQGHRDMPFATLSVDACATDSIVIADKIIPKDQPSDAFTNLFYPLSTDEKCFPLSIQGVTTEQGGIEQTDLFKYTVNALSKLRDPVRILFIATDSDTCSHKE